MGNGDQGQSGGALNVGDVATPRNAGKFVDCKGEPRTSGRQRRTDDAGNRRSCCHVPLVGQSALDAVTMLDIHNVATKRFAIIAICLAMTSSAAMGSSEDRRFGVERHCVALAN